MLKIVRKRIVVLILIFSFILYYSPRDLKAQRSGKGNLRGIIYEKDKTTPIEGAIVHLRNVTTGTVYKSSKSDKLGIFKAEGIDEGLYTVSISTKEGYFNTGNFVGIRENEYAFVAIALILAQFFLSPIGIILIIAASAAIVYGTVQLTEEEPEASPFKK